ADDHRHTRRVCQQGGGRARERLAQGVVRRLRRAVGPGDAEGPVLDRAAAGVPVVRPGEEEGAGQAYQRGRAHVAGEEAGLLRFAVPERVHAELAEDERLVADQVLQAEQVTAERLGVVEVDVEGDEVQEGDVQVLRGRVAGVGDEALRVGLFADVPQLGEEALHASGTV